MSPVAQDYTISTVIGAAAVTVGNQLVRMAASKPSVGRNDIIAAVGGAILANVIKAGITHYTRNQTPSNGSPLKKELRRLLNPVNFIAPALTAAASVALIVLVRRA